MATTPTITFRLTPREVATLDALVDAGAPDRTSAIRRALAREQRRLDAEHDAAIYARLGNDPDLDALAEWSADQGLDID